MFLAIRYNTLWCSDDILYLMIPVRASHLSRHGNHTKILISLHPGQGRTNIGWRVKLHPQPNFWKRAKRAMSQPIFSLRAKLIILAAKILLWSAIAASCSCSQPKILKRAVFTYTVFRVRRITFFLVNRVENQNEPKQPQKWWPFGFVLVFNSIR